MVRVRIDTAAQADALTRSVMEEVADEYRSTLEGVACPDHGEPPTVVISGTSRDRITIQIETCCDELQRLVDGALTGEED